MLERRGMFKISNFKKCEWTKQKPVFANNAQKRLRNIIYSFLAHCTWRPSTLKMDFAVFLFRSFSLNHPWIWDPSWWATWSSCLLWSLACPQGARRPTRPVEKKTESLVRVPPTNGWQHRPSTDYSCTVVWSAQNDGSTLLYQFMKLHQSKQTSFPGLQKLQTHSQLFMLLGISYPFGTPKHANRIPFKSWRKAKGITKL